jgi:hypothetical protein
MNLINEALVDKNYFDFYRIDKKDNEFYSFE